MAMALQKSEDYRLMKLTILSKIKNQITNEKLQVLNAKYCEKKIRNVAPEHLDELFKKTIAHIVILRGIKTLPDEITYEGLRRSLLYHQNLTFAEINLAFELDNMRLLGERVNHFGLFSVEFFTDVLIKFRDFSDSIFHEYRMKFELEKPKEFIPPSNTTYYNSLVEYVKEHRIVPQFWAWQNVYEHMKDSNMIGECKSWKDEFIVRIKNKYDNENQLNLLSGFKKSNETLQERVRSEYVKMRMNLILDSIN
jgi:hypothetical protein